MAEMDAKVEQERYFGAARMVAGLTGVSRVFGMARDMVLVPLGTARLADAFWLAFGVPHLFRRLFGEGALTAAFVPVFTEADVTAGPQRARLVLGNTAALLTAVLTALVGLIELGLAAWLLLAPGPPERAYTLRLLMLMLPFAVAICLLALLSGALNSRGHFFYPALAPVLLNLGLIVGGWVGPTVAPGAGQFYFEGVIIVAVGFLHLLPAVWIVRRARMLGPLVVRPVLPEVRAIARKMGPTLVPLSMMQFADLATRVVAMAFTVTAASPHMPLEPGVIRCNYAAGRLYQFPLGVLAVSISTVVFPLLSRYAARGDRDGLRDALTRALRLCVFLGIPAGAGMIVLARPVVAAIFQREHFTGGSDPLSDVSRTAAMLRMYCLGMPAYFAVHVLLRAFFAQKETRGPLIVSSVLGLLNVALVVVGIWTPLRSAAMGLATAVAFSINAVVFGWLIQHKVGRLDWRTIGVSAGRACVATAAMAAAAWWSWEGLGHVPMHRALRLAAAVIAGACVFLAAARFLRCAELSELLRRQSRSG